MPSLASSASFPLPFLPATASRLPGFSPSGAAAPSGRTP